MNTHTTYCQMSNFVSSYLNDTQGWKDNLNNQDLQIDSFKEKFIFKPFEYEQSLQQTLKHQIKSLNPKKNEQEHLIQQNQLNKNKVQFIQVSKPDSFAQTSKSIKTNKTIWGPQLNNSLYQTKTNKNSISKQSKLFSKGKNFLKSPQNQKNQYNKKKQNFSNKNCQKDEKVVAFNTRNMTKKPLYIHERYQQNQKNKHSKSKNLNRRPSANYLNFTDSHYSPNNQTQQNSPSMCQSIAMGSMMVQNFLTSTFENGLVNSHGGNNQSLSSRTQSNLPEPLNFYSLCMLLFPQNPRSVPCSVFIIDTLFYNITNESKEIIYVFKDRRRNLLVKMKNKGKNAFDLFLKRRQNYQISKAKGDKLFKSGFQHGIKMKKVSIYEDDKVFKNEVRSQQKNDRLSLDQEIQNRILMHSQNRQNEQMITQPSCFQIITGDIKSKYQIIREQNDDDIFKHEDQIIDSDQEDNQTDQIQLNLQNNKLEHISQDVISLSSQKSVQNFKQKLTKLTFQNTYKKFMTQKTQKQYENKKLVTYGTVVEQYPIITPSNSVRDSFHSLQTNYMSLLKYNNGQIIRLKAHQFKAIYQNPLYANERFKNNNNTQYIQTLPVQDQFKDIKVYSMHFHYELFKNQPLFLHVKNSLYKQNQYMTGINKNYFDQTDKKTNHNRFSRSNASNDNISIERKNNLILKKKLKQQSIEVYLYYQIFQIYTYASMHYNKQITNGIFRFIEYDKDYALFETQNVVVKQMQNNAEFIKAKIFQEQQSLQNLKQNEINKLKQLQKQTFNFSPQNTTDLDAVENNDTPSQTIQKITKQMLKLTTEPKQQQSQVQKAILSYFTEENTKIKSEMSNYFTQKIQKIKNIKDMDLSKNVFKVINGISDQNEESQKSWNNFYNKNESPLDFHQILNDDRKLQKFLKNKEKNDLYSRKNISNFSLVRCQKEVNKVRQEKKNLQNEKNQLKQNSPLQITTSQNDKNDFINNIFILNRPQTAKTVKFESSSVSRPDSVCNYTSVKSFNKLTKTNRSLISCQKDKNTENESKKVLKNSQSLKSLGHNQILLCQRPLSGKQHQQFEKKLINQRYTQFNKSKFKLNAYKTDKFI